MSTPSHLGHKQQAPASIACGVITVSDTRTVDTDKSGQLIRELLDGAGHRTAEYHIVPDEPTHIRPLLEQMLAKPGVEAVIINGGTGVARRDVTFDVIQTMVDKPIPGFGELFRQLSYAEIGSAALLSRAMAGIVAGGVGNSEDNSDADSKGSSKVVFSVPGSSGAVRLAMEKLILPEMPHIVFELRK